MLEWKSFTVGACLKSGAQGHHQILVFLSGDALPGLYWIGYLGNFHSTCCHSDILQHIGPCFGCKLVMPVDHEQWCIICITQQKPIVGELLAEAQQSSVTHRSRSISQVIIFQVRSQSVSQTSHSINKVKNVKKKRFELCWCTCVLSFVQFLFSAILHEFLFHLETFLCFIFSRHSAAWHVSEVKKMELNWGEQKERSHSSHRTSCVHDWCRMAEISCNVVQSNDLGIYSLFLARTHLQTHSLVWKNVFI